MAHPSKWFAVLVLPGLLASGTAQAGEDIQIARGKIKSVMADKLEFVVVDQNDKQVQLALGENALIHPGDRTLTEDLRPEGKMEFTMLYNTLLGMLRLARGPKMDFADLQLGDRVVVAYLPGKRPVALEVAVQK
jgi:hypothetical protein